MHQTQRLSLALQLHRLQHKTQKLMNKSKKSQRKIRQAPRCSKMLQALVVFCTFRKHMLHNMLSCFFNFFYSLPKCASCICGCNLADVLGNSHCIQTKAKAIDQTSSERWANLEICSKFEKACQDVSSKGKKKQLCSLFGSTLVCFLPIPNKSPLCFSVYQFCQETAHDEKGQSWSKASE